MKYVSEKFKQAQDEIIRPPYKNIRFFIGTDNGYPHNAVGGSLNPLNFDTSVAPVVAPKFCSYANLSYAVLGDGQQVDNQWRICAPDNSGGSFSEPNGIIVPYGVTEYANANEEVIIGNSTPALNFTNIMSRTYIQFTGGHTPTKLVVEWYDTKTSTWKTSGTYTGTGDSWWFRYNNPNPNLLTRFKVSAPTAGRFQLSNVKEQWSIENGLPTLILDTNKISKIAIDEDTDLTSQTLPDYEYSVECRDINNEYTPDSDNWK